MAYANSKEAKQRKRHALLKEVHRQMIKKSFEEIRIIDVAKGCGVAKGTVFNYFESKESLFLALLIQEYSLWFEGLYQLIDQEQGLSLQDLKKLIADYVEQTVDSNERLFVLIGLGHSRLEHNVPLREAERYRRLLNDRVAALGNKMSVSCKDVTTVQGIKLMMTLHTSFVGHIQMSTLPAVMNNGLPLEELEAYEADFKVSVLALLKVYMNGLF